MTTNYVKGRVVAITGAGSGFGKATAEKVVAMGGKVVLTDISKERLDTTVEELKAKGGQVAAMVGDVAKYEDNEAFVKLAVDTFGELDVFVVNAGTMPLADWEHHRKALPAWDKCIDINLKGPMYAISACYDLFKKQERGHMVFVSSIYGNFPVRGSGVYQATKIGIRYLANTLRQEEGGFIKVSIVNPTGITTTNLAKDTVVDAMGGLGIQAWNWEKRQDYNARKAAGETLPEEDDIQSIKNWWITPDELTDGLIYCINQPWGVNIGEITVRASNEVYIL